MVLMVSKSEKAVKLKKIPVSEAKRKILEYLKEHPGSWTSDIAVGLGIDVDVVIKALEELRREGKVK
jgi:predicted ArsR family transcriptional regulator